MSAKSRKKRAKRSTPRTGIRAALGRSGRVDYARRQTVCRRACRSISQLAEGSNSTTRQANPQKHLRGSSKTQIWSTAFARAEKASFISIHDLWSRYAVISISSPERWDLADFGTPEEAFVMVNRRVLTRASCGNQALPSVQPVAALHRLRRSPRLFCTSACKKIIQHCVEDLFGHRLFAWKPGTLPAVPLRYAVSDCLPGCVPNGRVYSRLPSASA